MMVTGNGCNRTDARVSRAWSPGGQACRGRARAWGPPPARRSSMATWSVQVSTCPRLLWLPTGTWRFSGLAGWGAGAICLGLTFRRLARLVPATGGPYCYTQLAYGDFAGFLIAWGYWTSIWSSLPVIAIAFAGVVIDLFPVVRGRGTAIFLTL